MIVTVRKRYTGRRNVEALIPHLQPPNRYGRLSPVFQTSCKIGEARSHTASRARRKRIHRYIRLSNPETRNTKHNRSWAYCDEASRNVRHPTPPVRPYASRACVLVRSEDDGNAADGDEAALFARRRVSTPLLVQADWKLYSHSCCSGSTRRWRCRSRCLRRR